MKLAIVKATPKTIDPKEIHRYIQSVNPGSVMGTRLTGPLPVSLPPMY
jgi:hypothetical protein